MTNTTTTLPRCTVTNRDVLPYTERQRGDVNTQYAYLDADEVRYLLVALDDPENTGFWSPTGRADVTPDMLAALPADPRCWWVRKAANAILPVPADLISPDLQQHAEQAAEVARLTEQVAALTEERDRAREETRLACLRHTTDIDVIGRRLIEEANAREWCETYDRVIDEVNGSLHVELPLRESDVEVEVTGYLRVPFNTTLTVRILGGEFDETRVRDVIDDNDFLDADDLMRYHADSGDAMVEDEYEVNPA